MTFLHFCKGGELHFLQIGGVSEDVDDGDMFIDAPLSKGAELLHEGAKSSSHPCSPGNAGKTPHTHTPPGSIFIEFLLWAWCPVCSSSCRPPCGPATNHRKPDGPGGADVLRDVDPAFLCDCASVLGRGATGAAAAPPPAAPPPAASWRCSPAHTYLEASEWQVAFQSVWISILLIRVCSSTQTSDSSSCERHSTKLTFWFHQDLLMLRNRSVPAALCCLPVWMCHGRRSRPLWMSEYQSLHLLLLSE